MATQGYEEEAFGILTDDQMYLDCVLVKPPAMEDENLRVLRVWVPKSPLTKSSVITCARQEVKSYGPKGRIAHLVFDLRGTGESDGDPADTNFARDLHAIADWANERFGKINFGFLGTPLSENGRVYMWPLREGTMMESYYYHPGGTAVTSPTVLYLSTYGNFGRSDDALCTSLATAGYAVYGMDPLRYLLHASARNPLTPEQLTQDFGLLLQMLPSSPYIIAQPLAAGLGLMWASQNREAKGIISVGRAQAGLSMSHIFHNRNPHRFQLTRFVQKISPRPLALVLQSGHALGGSDDELGTLYQHSKLPNRLERIEKVSTENLLALLAWMQEKQA